MKIQLGLALAIALSAAACGGDSNSDSGGPGGIETGKSALTGRIATTTGHQSVAPGLANDTADRTASITTADHVIARDTAGTILGEADVADGVYAIENITEANGAVVVEAIAAGEVVGSALIPDGVGEGALAAMPISVETTAEVEAFMALMADGHAAAEIDAVGLMDCITAEMASQVTDGEELASAVWAEQEAYIAGLAAEGVETAAAAVADAQAEAFNRLAAAIDGGEAEVDAALEAYEAEAAAALETALGAAEDAQVLAEEAAGFALAHELSDSAAGEAAAAAAADAIADAEERVQRELAAGLGDLDAQITAAYDTFEDAIDSAASGADLAAAHEALALTLYNDEGGNIFDDAIAEGSELSGLPGGVDISAILAEALDEVQTALETAERELAAALNGLEGEVDVAAIMADFRREIESTLNEVLEETVSAEARALAVELAAAADGGAGAFLGR